MTDQSDDRLLQELRSACSRLDPIPPAAVAAARSAIMWRTVDAELAQLTADSASLESGLAGVRAGEIPVLLSFDIEGRGLELEVVAHGGVRRIFGQLVPAEAGRVVVLHDAGETTVDADEVGRFSVDNLTPGAIRIRWQSSLAAGAPAVETDWFLV